MNAHTASGINLMMKLVSLRRAEKREEKRVCKNFFLSSGRKRIEVLSPIAIKTMPMTLPSVKAVMALDGMILRTKER
ncbi:MAG: hypothetical protein S4CHLAM81_03020 [Chlamydiales bacterium]|nr:hypothetical protein [Chlamydiales bacterium]MCH9635092.1 hypothetical protein [Chlamydiales bacterium]